MMLKQKLLLLIKNSQPLLIIAGIIFLTSNSSVQAKSDDPTKYWDIRSVDTMKYSRDTAAAKLNDENFNEEIGTQMRNIKGTGANYVAIGTPYDERFVPFLKRWVEEARKNDLHVWFRGNFSAWEGWFGVRRGMSTQEHTKQIVQFIKNHPDLFADGDIFSSCPECENGSFGDPRQTGKVTEYRQFMVSETQAATQAFQDINERISTSSATKSATPSGKKIITNYWSMNLDVARLVMDQDTAAKLGGVIVIDHYVQSPQKLIQDADNLSRQSNANIILGEFGAPIPDLNGPQTDQEQADWLEQLLNLGSKSPALTGLNYWVSKGGSTAIWDENNDPKIAVKTLTNYFNPPLLSGHIEDEFGNPVNEATVSSAEKSTITQNGNFTIINDGLGITIKKDGYEDLDLETPTSTKPAEIMLIKKDKNIIDQLKLWIRQINFTFL